MHELYLSNLIMGTGGVLVVASFIQLLHQTLNVQRGKRERIHAGWSLKKSSLQSVFLGAAMFAVGAFLIGAGPLVDDH